jgi:CRISPR/Cas system CMR-associated protein Cmr3 (group 5 of RAMP superfamily)
MGIKIAQKHTKISITYEKENILQQERVLISANFLEYIQVKAACFFYVLTPEN